MLKPQIKRLVRSVLPQKLKRRCHDTWEHLPTDPFSDATKGITGTSEVGGAGFSNEPVILKPVEGREDVWDLENRQTNMINLKDLTLKFDFYRSRNGGSHSGVTLIRICVVWFNTSDLGTDTPHMNFDDVITGERGRAAGILHVFYDKTFSLKSSTVDYQTAGGGAGDIYLEEHCPVYTKIRLRGFGAEFDGDLVDDYIHGQAFLMMTCNSAAAADGNGVHVQTPSTYRLRYYG